MIKNTSFGSLEVLVEKQGEVLCERLQFDREGRGHSHPKWEICHVTDGQGLIVIDQERVDVKKGDVCKIPPNVTHWMIPKPSMEIVILYEE